MQSAYGYLVPTASRAAMPVDFQRFLHCAEESWMERERKEEKRGESQTCNLEGLSCWESKTNGKRSG